MQSLGGGSQLPELELKVGESDHIRLPADIETPYGLVLFFRGHW